MNILWFIPLGFLTGALGTLIGAGGGFMLMPILMLLYPDDQPELLTSISLAVVCLNALSGSAAYIRMRRVDFRAGLIFALAGLPGTFIGALVNASLDRQIFDVILGGFLIVMGSYLIYRTTKAAPTFKGDETSTRRDFNIPVGVGISVVVGFLSSLFGIGGGIIHVPALVYVLGFPAHIATATSHFVLAITTFAVTLYHWWTGGLDGGLYRALALGLGVIFGAQAGAVLSKKVRATWIIRCLAVGLITVGARVFFRALFH